MSEQHRESLPVHGSVCSMHGAEVERRRTTEELVRDVRVTLTTVTKFMYVMTGVAVFGLLIITGSYYYTDTLSKALSARQDITRMKIDTLSTELARTNTAVAVAEDRYSRILSQLNDMSRNLEKLANNGKVPD